MTTAALQIGDQLILEEDYDENYIPSEQEIHEYAREIGIDPDREPELLWLAREGMVAPLPAEWKPCQDVTGDIYYFNFSSGQSIWEHPCDEHYRRLVVQERERHSRSTPAAAAGKKDKEKKKKKDKKEKKEKKKEQDALKAPGPLSSALGPLQAPLGSLAPLRGFAADAPIPALRGSLGSSGGLDPLKTSLGGPGSSIGSSLLGGRNEERVSLSLPGFEDEEDDKASGDESPRGTTRLLHNLHLDLDDLGRGLQYEESEVSGTAPPEERTEPELQDLALSGDHSPEPPSQDSLRGRHLHSSPPGGSRELSSGDVCPPTLDAQPCTGMDKTEDELNGEGESIAEEEEYEEDFPEEDGNARETSDGEEKEDIDEVIEQCEASCQEAEEENERAKCKSVEREREASSKEEESEVVVVEYAKCKGASAKAVSENEESSGASDHTQGEGKLLRSEDNAEKGLENEEDCKSHNDEVERERVADEGEQPGKDKDGDEVLEQSVEIAERLKKIEEEEEEESEIVERCISEEVKERSEEDRDEDLERSVQSSGERSKEKEDESEEVVEMCVENKGGKSEDESEAVERCVKSSEDEAESKHEADDGGVVEGRVEISSDTGTVDAEEQAVRKQTKDEIGDSEGKEESDDEEVIERCVKSSDEREEENDDEENRRVKNPVEEDRTEDGVNEEIKCGTAQPREEDSDDEVEERCVKSTEEEEEKEQEKNEEKEDEKSDGAVSNCIQHQNVENEEMKTEEVQKLAQSTFENAQNKGGQRDAKMSESDEEEIERFGSPKRTPVSLVKDITPQTLTTRKGHLGKVLVPQRDRLPSEAGFRSRLSENILDLKDLTTAEHSPLLGHRHIDIVRAPIRLRAAGKEDPTSVGERAQTQHGLYCETSSSISSSSLSKPGGGLPLEVGGSSLAYLGPRPETSRGRLKEREEEAKKREEERERQKKRREEEREREEEEIEKQIEKERNQALQERQRRLRLLREELKREEQEEERRMREEKEEKIRELKQRLQRERREEEDRLTEETHRRLQELRERALRERESQQRAIREEGEVRLRALRSELEAERAAERERMEAQWRRELERLRAESEEELRAERRRLQERKEEQLSSLKQEVRGLERQRDLRSPRSEQQLMEYQRELTDLLQEVREDVQREHRRKLEQLKEDHRQELHTLREKHLEEESRQREQLLRSLQEERDRLLASHSAQLEQLRSQLDIQLQSIRNTHSQKEVELQEKAEQIQMKAKELKTQETLLQTQAAELRKRREQLMDEEDEVQRGMEALPRVLRERDGLRAELERMREERDRLKEEVERLREENGRIRKEREKLESKITSLQERYDKLSLQMSELESAGPSSRPDGEQKKETEKEGEEERRRKERALQVEDLERPLSASPLPLSRDSPSSMEDIRQYICAEGLSLQRARRFLESQAGRLTERRAALRAAQSSLQDPSLQTSTQQLFSNLQQEASTLEQLQETVQRGNSLLRRKEERLHQLENSVAEELSFEERDRLATDRKVTFDVSESDMSSVDGNDGTSSVPTVPVKVQQLAESLQQISGQLNTVLGALGSLTQTQSPLLPSTLPPNQTPSSQLLSAPPLRTFSHASSTPLIPPPTWAWSANHTSTTPSLNGLSSHTSITSGLTTAPRGGTDELLTSRWAKLFPGDGLFLSALPPTLFKLLVYGAMLMLSSLRFRSFHGYWGTPVHKSLLYLFRIYSSKSVEVDSQRLQGLIEGNKRWLETRRKDPSIPLFPRYRTPPSLGGLVQLSLDENNQIKVYHY
ncbi:centrosomal protein of 164 kDa [Chanos chanos]|uniref:Centrosomal protein of 164 kDa n=1 Tax=Chanos chanos TaxID=29144 RepID=A0A6J2VL45_CHACN|nr:centrosomal protein of 164 kDa-like [Chanos chanos]